MKQLLTRPAVQALLTIAMLRRTVSTLLELTAVALIAIVVATVTAPVWALVPAAVYLLIVAISLGRPTGRGSSR